MKLSQGTCTENARYLSVNIGVWSHGAAHPPNYFGLDVGRIPGTSFPRAGKDGTYKKGVVVAFDDGGKSYAVDSDLSAAAATLSGSRTKGTVTGKAITGESISATFHC